MKLSDGIQHVVELCLLVNDGGAEVVCAGALAEPGAGYHEDTCDKSPLVLYMKSTVNIQLQSKRIFEYEK